MDITTIQQKYNQEKELFNDIIESLIITEISGYHCINGYVCISVITASSLDKNQERIDIKNNNTLIGFLYLTNNQEIIDSRLTLPLYCAYLIDTDEESFQAQKIQLNSDYIIIEEEHFQDYLTDFYETAPLWGHFFHKNQAISITPKTSNITTLQAKSLTYRTDWHKENAIRAIQQPYTFERFLKKYHLIELLFDYQFAENIQEQDKDTPGGLKNIIKLAQNYKRDDIERLTDIIRAKCANIPNLVQKLNLLQSFKAQVEDIFFVYGKESNPVKKDFTDFWTGINDGIFSFHIANVAKTGTIKIISNNSSTNPNLAQEQQKQQAEYEGFILKFVAYCIYRVRSSIAHHKIGDYLMTQQDEDFMLQFAEPLIDEIIHQAFKR